MWQFADLPLSYILYQCYNIINLITLSCFLVSKITACSLCSKHLEIMTKIWLKVNTWGRGNCKMEKKKKNGRTYLTGKIQCCFLNCCTSFKNKETFLF